MNKKVCVSEEVPSKQIQHLNYSIGITDKSAVNLKQQAGVQSDAIKNEIEAVKEEPLEVDDWDNDWLKSESVPGKEMLYEISTKEESLELGDADLDIEMKLIKDEDVSVGEEFLESSGTSSELKNKVEEESFDEISIKEENLDFEEADSYAEMETYFLGDSTMTGYLSMLQPLLQNTHQMDVRLQDVGEIIRHAQGYTFVIFHFREELLQRCGRGRVTYPMAFDAQQAVEELLHQLKKGREANKNAHMLICLADVVNIPAINRSKRKYSKREQHRDLRALTRGAHFLARIWYTLNKHKHPYTTHINLRDLSPTTLKHHPYNFLVMDHTRCTRFLTDYKINNYNDGSSRASSVLPALFAQRLTSFFSSVPRPPTRVEVTLQDEDAISESDEWLNERELLQEPASRTRRYL